MPRETGKARRTGGAHGGVLASARTTYQDGPAPRAPHRPGARSSGSACRAERREQLLAAATRAFARAGFAATGLDDIAAQQPSHHPDAQGCPGRGLVAGGLVGCPHPRLVMPSRARQAASRRAACAQ
jgi:hypothetical protein